MRMLLALLLGLTFTPQLDATISVNGPTGPGGIEPAVDLPPTMHMKHNIGSPYPKGPGCCVFRSINYAADYQGVKALHDFPEWMVSKGIVGGGWDGKVSQLIPEIAKDRGLPIPGFVQFTGSDPAIIEAALKSGRVPCVTYSGHDPHYSGPIAHMVCCVLFDRAKDMAAIRDNNYPGDSELVFMSIAEFLQRWNGDGGWVVVLTDQAPVPSPHSPPKLE